MRSTRSDDEQLAEFDDGGAAMSAVDLVEHSNTGWHACHFCGTTVRGGYEVDGTRHWLSDCRPDLTEHEPGELCTWPERSGVDEPGCYAPHEDGVDYVYQDGPT